MSELRQQLRIVKVGGAILLGILVLLLLVVGVVSLIGHS